MVARNPNCTLNQIGASQTISLNRGQNCAESCLLK